MRLRVGDGSVGGSRETIHAARVEGFVVFYSASQFSDIKGALERSKPPSTATKHRLLQMYGHSQM